MAQGNVQAIAAAQTYTGGHCVKSTAIPCGKSLASDAELLALHTGFHLATEVLGARLIVVFTDSLLLAESLVNPVPKSGQGHCVASSWKLFDWLKADPLWEITFVHTRAQLLWSIEHEAHLVATDQRSCLPMPAQPFVSLNFVRKQVMDSCKEAWKTSFCTTAYRNSNFLDFKGANGKPLSPSYVDGGMWLKFLGNIWLCSWVTCGILDHAPHGEFQMCFHIEGDLTCSYCGSGAIQTQQHLVSHCTTLAHLQRFNGFPTYLLQFIEYCKENFWIFSFNLPLVGIQCR
jgi:hypothetical protein